MSTDATIPVWTFTTTGVRILRIENLRDLSRAYMHRNTVHCSLENREHRFALSVFAGMKLRGIDMETGEISDFEFESRKFPTLADYVLPKTLHKTGETS